MNTSEECAVTARRRSPRLHPQIKASEESAGVIRRRSPRLHPQIHASQDGARRIRRRRGTSPAGPCYMPDEDNMLREILIRIPSEPSSLPRASAVCKRWLGLVTDPKFHRQFYEHHRKPPILGVFLRTSNEGIVFNPILDPPDCIPRVRFSVARHSNNHVLDCRHGRLLLGDHRWKKMVRVCDPITGEQRRVAIPSEFERSFFEGAVLCADSNQGHVHGGCHSSPFKVVLMIMGFSEPLARVCVYSSETGGWGNVISTAARNPLGGHVGRPTLVGNAIYWLANRNQILEFDLDGQRLAVIEGPPFTNHARHQIIQGEDGLVGFAILSRLLFQTFQRNINGYGVATWMPWKTIEMHTVLGLPSPIERMSLWLLGYDEDNGVLFLYVNGSVYTVLLILMQSKKLHETRCFNDYYPFASFYTPAIRGCDEAEALHNS